MTVRIPQNSKDQKKKEWGRLREQLKDEGYFDGRYRTRVYKSKKKKLENSRNKYRYDNFDE